MKQQFVINIIIKKVLLSFFPISTHFYVTYFHLWYISFCLFPPQLSFSPTSAMFGHAKVLMLLVSIIVCCLGFTVLCGIIGFQIDISLCLFMLAEVRIHSIVNGNPLVEGFGKCRFWWLPFSRSDIRTSCPLWRGCSHINQAHLPIRHVHILKAKTNSLVLRQLNQENESSAVYIAGLS